ncbi:FecR family protein [Shinella sp. CPCC 101442]|uniref:FecR family protein n=1 Tax=Shinella sp. CPCC 101442 TaxID=2932265 RepID=UPI002152E779|nr:FecR family protein [Shinella sp. CPCC 101442]MCR6500812.1 FecR family protein [Shinella sp. CPCC 101442]
MRTLDALRPVLLSRRLLIAGGALALTGIGLRATQANSIIGKAVEITGDVSRKQANLLEGLKAGASLMDHDFVKTGKESFAELALGDDTSLLLGSETELLIDTFIAGQGGTIELGTGQMVFDRPEGLAKIDLTMRTAFGMIGVRGTKFFAGPSRKAPFAVFVEHGRVEVTGGGVTRSVSGGEGVEINAPGAAPGEVVKWGEARIREAYASVGIR